MKTAKNLYKDITSFENLLSAGYQAAQGKREREYVLQFFQKLEDNIWQIQKDLCDRSYWPGKYSTFEIYRPKNRMISAAPFRDRIVHHALINIIGPILEKGFLFDCYANRLGKGTHRAIRRYQQFLRNFAFVLKCDLKKYFPSIDHEILKKQMRTKIADNKTLWLIDTIIEHSNDQEFVREYFAGDTLFSPIERKRGLPIGNLTSQYFANFYLDGFDHFVKEVLGCRAYVRYVDDFVLFSDSKKELWRWLKAIDVFLESLRLKLNSKRVMLYPSHVGTSFLGQMVYKSHRRLCRANVSSFYKRWEKWQVNPPENMNQRLAALKGHANQADTIGLLKHLRI